MFESKFRYVYGATLCFGGPHEVFTRGYKQAGFCVTLGMLQVLFTESATAYMGGIRAVVGASIEEEEAAGSVSDLASAPPAVTTQPVSISPAGDATTEKASESPSSVPQAEETAQPEIAAEAAASGATGDPPNVPLPATAASPSRLLGQSRKRLRLG